MVRRVVVVCAVTLALAASAHAQTGFTGTSTAQSSSDTRTQSSSAGETRPATTTFFGDTGLWYVPTAEVLANGKWSVSAYRRGINYIQGYTNVADFAGTFAYGIGDRTEIFGSFLFDTRIDRDTLPIFVNDRTFGGIVDRYPKVNSYWTGDNIGDLYVGAKFNIMSEARRNPVAMAVRGLVKVPTGKASAGVSTGKADVFGDFIVSKELAKVVEVSGYAGYQFAGSPDGFDIPTSAFRWGGGASFPSRSPVRIFTELVGLVPSASTATITGPFLVGVDGSVAPIVSNTEDLTRTTVGVTFQAPNGFFIGGGVGWSVPTLPRNGAFTAADNVFGTTKDYWDWQVRLGYHPGVRATPSSTAGGAGGGPGGAGVGRGGAGTGPGGAGAGTGPGGAGQGRAGTGPGGAGTGPGGAGTGPGGAGTGPGGAGTGPGGAGTGPGGAGTGPGGAGAGAGHDLTVKAACNPCTVEVGKTSTVTATAQDSIRCAVTYRWATPTGTLANPSQPQTLWTAPQQVGSVPVTVTVTCPSDGKTASDTVNIQVVRASARSYTFEDVHFDFDRYSLRPEAIRVLDEAVNALRTDATLKVQIEGHTCNIGTAEYNLALGDRRANAVKDYLVNRGVPLDRLSTVSYGEERPKFDNSREETRRLNRRAALVVNLQR